MKHVSKQGQNIAYIRVSTTTQNTDRQLADCGVVFDKEFTDKCSGSNTNRPALQAMKGHVREGDTIHVHSIDRLARSLSDLQTLVTDWVGKGITIRFHKEGLTFTGDNSPMNTLLLNMLGAVSQFEREIILERQREGIAKAKEKGVYQGRKADESLHDKIKELRAEGVSIRKIAQQLGCGVSTVQRVIA